MSFDAQFDVLIPSIFISLDFSASLCGKSVAVAGDAITWYCLEV